MDVTRDRLDIRQVDVDGKVIDAFAVTRPSTDALPEATPGR